MAKSIVNMLADFAPQSTQEWKDKIVADLKGADFDKKLVWRTPEGFNVQPYYRLEDLEGLKTTESAPGQFPFVRGTKDNNEWLVRQNIVVADPKEANAKALDVLNKGINSLGFRINKEDLSADFIAALLQDILPQYVELNFTTCVGASPVLVDLLADYFTAKGYNLDLLEGSINVDPLDKMLHGKELDRQFVADRVAAIVAAQKRLPKYRVVAVNSIDICNAGAYCSQELGYALAWGAEYMTMLTEAGVDAKTAGLAIKFNMGVQGNYFMEIAKFRAARLLWAKIVKAYEPSCDCACKMKVNAETSTFNMTIFDAYVNLLRSQTEAMSAAIAGVDSIVVTPFDVTYKKPDDFSERIARNQQLLLSEESHFNKVVDPAAGSYYLENLTSMIADEAWKLFLAVQEDGGFYASAAAGKIQDALKANLTKRLADVAKRKESILGTNQFPNFTETTDGKIQDLSGDCGCGKHACGPNAIPSMRAAEEFEQLRLATEKSAHRPKAFMLTIGNLAMRLARSQFSCNFFACAGYEVVDNNGFKTVEEGVDAALAAKADIIVLCSSDDEYAEYAPAAFKYLAGRAEFVVAGAPACMEDLKAAGINNYVHVRVNVLEELKKYSEKLLK